MNATVVTACPAIRLVLCERAKAKDDRAATASSPCPPARIIFTAKPRYISSSTTPTRSPLSSTVTTTENEGPPQSMPATRRSTGTRATAGPSHIHQDR